MVKIGEFWYPFDNQFVRNNRGVVKGLPRKFITDWSLAIDGGAYIGGWTRELCTLFKRVIAIELAADNFACLVKNVPEAECIHACLSDSHERVGYEGDSHPASPIRRVVPGDEVKSITIDSLDLPECGFIKLDLQGYDLKALRGARKTLEKFHPTVKFESEKRTMKRYGNVPLDADDYLHSLGYRCAKKTNEPVYIFD